MRIKPILLALLIIAGTTATSCVVDRAVAVVPSKALGADGTRDSVVAVVTRIAQRHGAKEFMPDQAEEHWVRCFMVKGAIMLCGKQNKGETQLHMYTRPGARVWLDSLNHEVLDSLRSGFGKTSVRECGWRLSGKPEGSGCRVANPVGG